MPTLVGPDLGKDIRRALICAGTLVCLQVAGKSARDALFCAVYSPSELPRVMTAGAILSVAFALGAARLFRTYGPGRVVPALLVVNALGFLVEYLLLPVWPRPIALVLYLHVAAVGAVVVSGFWSVASERFDPHTLRTSMPRLGFGATLGGLAGGLFAERVAAFGGARSTLLGLLGLSLLGAFAIFNLSRFLTPTMRPAAAEPLRAKVLDSSYLRWLSAFVALTALSSSIVDFAFKARAMERFTGADELVQFFGLFYTATSLVALLVQLLITPRLLEREGLDAALAALPVSIIAAGVGALVLPGLPTQALLKGADTSLTSSLHRSAYEPLYTPLPAHRKRESKAVIDVVVDKLGDALGGILTWALVLLLPAAAAPSATGAAVGVAMFSLLLTVRLHRGYVAELAASLRTGSVRVDDGEVRDRTTRLTLSRTQLEIDRERLLAEIQGLRERGQLTMSVAPPAAGTSSTPARSSPEITSLLPRIEDLLSHDSRRIARALVEPPVDVRLAPFIIPLLGRDDVGGEAMNVLASLGARVTGQVSDALLDLEHVPAKTRRRIARVLANLGGDRAANALVHGLADPEFDVRRQVARALAGLRRQGVSLPLERAEILALVARDLKAEHRVRPEQRMEYAFTLLGLVQDAEALALAHRALASADQKLRGTALEYLENVLPPDVRSELYALIQADPVPSAGRGAGELLAELKRTLG